MAAAVATVAVVVGAVVAQGYDAQQTDRVESSVWVFRDAGQYARVNTSLGQIDTVRSVDDPKSVVQHGPDAAVVAQGGRLLWPVDPAAPADLSENQDQSGSVGTPDGTETVASAGGWVLYQTNGGEVWVGDLTEPQASTNRLEPAPDADKEAEDSAQYAATAATVDADGRVAVYSAAEGAVRVLDATSGALVSGPVSVGAAPAKDADLSMALVSGSWVLFDAGEGRLWTAEHTGAVEVDLGTLPKLQVSGGQGSKVYLADDSGLVEVGVRSGDAKRIVQARGSAARPLVMADGLVVAAWLTSAGGTLWTSDRSDTRALDVDPADLGDQQQLNPVIVSNGDRAVLEETGTGLLWTVPDGTAIPLSQWSRIDQQTTTTGTQKVTEVTEEMPPVAVPDSFGVRAGAHVRLPVLLNDYDPNSGDVLTIDPASVSELADPGFGQLTLTNADQMFVVQVQAASGSTTFSYQVTDGMMTSEPATVTLTVVDDATNVEPTWCVDQCSQTWPTPTLAPGGTVRVPIIDSWVDPDGDPFVLSSATVDDPAAPIHAVASADGTVTVHHTDPNGGPTSASVTVTVTDSHGAAAQRQLDVQVTSAPTLEVEPLALVTGQDVAATAVAADHVSSGSGSYRLVSADASAASADGLEVVASPDGTITATPRRPGQYQATYTVHDEVTGAEASAVLRVICPEGDPSLTMTPLTAFVRSHQDSTVDVLSAVEATTDNVLTLTQATAVPARADGYDATLTADIVDGSLLRLRGSTADGGPGMVGTVTVTVSDGASTAVTGQVAVFAVPEALGPPIAVPDTATVRVGAQVDIPVTANDVAPGGAALQVVPDSVVGSGETGEMAFGSGALVRYVAPDKPGTYQLRYSVAPVGYLEASATTTVQVTVVPAGANRDPVPPPLVARVAAGQSVHIPVPTSGADPDGDPVVAVGVTQPSAGKGTATVADTGDAIVYQALASATTDQVTFTYRVRDPFGGEGTGTVRVAVTASDASGRPVAYTDRVRLRQGDPVPAVIEPLANDHDPAGGRLTLHAVRPDAPTAEDDPERSRLAGLVDTSQMDEGRVAVTAGDVLGTHAYVYTVRSSQTGSTAEGLLVVEVTEGSRAETPQVADTVLTAARRADLSRDGIDVVSGKVVWPAGDPSSLTLEVWGPAADRYTTAGARIVGPLPERGALVPFTLRGTDRSGNAVEAHAFLRIPAFDDMRVSADPGAKVVQVDEGSSTKITVTDRVTLASGDRLEVADAESFGVQRLEASCVPSGQGTVTYHAGNGAPWTDTCLARVRLAGQTTWTDLVVPVQVAPKAPQPQLASTSLTIAPGASETVDLKSLTTWEGGRVGDESKLTYSTSLQSDGFTLDQRGTTVTITASSGAVPGTRSTATVTVAAYGGLQSSIDLVVGQAAPDAPRGATVSASCEAGDGSCTVQLVGVPGEYDPFAGKPGAGLTLVQVGGSGGPSCAAATVTATDARSATVTWPSAERPAGGSCQVTFTVRDAQGRAGTGLLRLELPGYPGKPQATLAESTENSVTFDVALSAVPSHPPVTAVSVYQDGNKVADCGSVSRCRVGGLTPNEPHSYTVRARNAVGESEDSSPVQAWAWRAPAITVTADRVEAVSTAQGRVWLTIESGNDATAFWIRNQRYSRDSRTTTIPLVLPVGNHEIEVIPVGAVEPPAGAGPANGTTQVSVRVVGLPIVNVGGLNVAGGTARIEGASVDGNNSPLPTRLTYAMSEDSSVTCSDDGSPRGGRNRQDNSTGVFSGLANNREYWFTVCGTNGYGAAGGHVGSEVVFGDQAPTVARGYQMSTTPTAQGGGYVYLSAGPPQVSTADGMTASFSFDGGQTWPGTMDSFQSWAGWGNGTVPDVRVRQCGAGGRCSAAAAVPPAGPSSPGLIRAGEVSCDPNVNPFTFDQPGVSDSATTSSTTAADGKVTWTLSWRTGTPYSGLGSITVDSDNRCEAPPGP